MGLIIGYFMFVYTLPSKVEVSAHGPVQTLGPLPSALQCGLCFVACAVLHLHSRMHACSEGHPLSLPVLLCRTLR